MHTAPVLPQGAQWEASSHCEDVYLRCVPGGEQYWGENRPSAGMRDKPGKH